MKYSRNEQKYIRSNFRNTGYTAYLSAVNRCLFLSREARHLYSTISQYCYGDKKECEPSESRLALELRMTRNSVIKYVNELRESGLIYTSYNLKGTLTFTFKSIETVCVIRHSEMVWRIVDNLSNGNVSYTDLEKIIREYENTNLFNEVDMSDEPEKKNLKYLNGLIMPLKSMVYKLINKNQKAPLQWIK